MMRVAAYCRVSTDRADQANSFEAQQRYFEDFIKREPAWELHAVYADEGRTGTSTKKRDAFNQMIRDAEKGCFSLILTKEVSRFSRNLLDAIAYTRRLKARGIGVLFMTDGIDSRDPDAELRLSIMASIAQEESRKTSARVKWGQTRQMEKGVVFGRSMLGYRVEGGQMTVVPEEAALVRLIFHKYGVEKKGVGVLVRELQASGYRTKNGNADWSGSHILKILKNEKYVGDLVQKKTYTPDYLSHAKKINHGEEEKIILRDHHTPIVDRQLWDLVQAEIKKRRPIKQGISVEHTFSGKIRCGECGAFFVRRSRCGKNGTQVGYWRCYGAVSRGREAGCAVGRLLREDDVRQMVRQALGSLQIDRQEITEKIERLVAEIILREGKERIDEAERQQKKLVQLQEKKVRVMDAYFAGEISCAEMQTMKEHYEKEIMQLEIALAENEEKQGKPEKKEEAEISSVLMELLEGRREGEGLYRVLVEQIKVFKAGHTELRLCGLPLIFRFESR